MDAVHGLHHVFAPRYSGHMGGRLPRKDAIPSRACGVCEESAMTSRAMP